MVAHKSRLGAALVFLCFASVALAFTVAELLDRATALDATYAALVTRANDCPSGECSGAAAIESDFAAAESERSTLNADRATVNPCSGCQTLDGTLADVDAKAATMRNILDGWESGG